MSVSTFFPRISVQAKVLIPVLLFLVLVPAITFWTIDDDMRRQVKADSEQTLATADSIFAKLLEIRASNLVTRYSNEVLDSRFRAVAELGDPQAMSRYQSDLLGRSADDEVALFFNEKGRLVSSWHKDSAAQMQDFEKMALNLVPATLGGQINVGSAALGGKTYLFAAIPVSVTENGSMLGVLVVVNRIGVNAIQEFKALTQTEIVLLGADNQLAASTFQNEELGAAVTADITRDHEVTALLVENEHYQAIGGQYRNTASLPGFRYVLLSSYEQRLQAQADTRRALIVVSLLGILLGSVVVWMLVRRIVSPLRELRDTAEAVGHGDFQKRIERYSNDECGDLAQAFNQMTENLRNSRAELEKTVVSLKAAQAQLVQGEKLSAVGRFVAGVAHELNNPLTAVIGFSDLLLLNNPQGDEKTRRQLTLISKSAQRCHKIVQNLLGFARQHSPERKLVKINTVVEDVIDFMAFDLSETDSKLMMNLGQELPLILADSHQIQQVLVNIISNASQALHGYRKDGVIIVRTKQTGRVIQIEVEDNGPGISLENLAKIFEPFFTTKSVARGTGLGLSLSYGIVQEHGGYIYVQSQVGLGTTFTVELPVATEAERPAEEPAFADPKQAGIEGVGHSVLVVDDEEWLRDLVRALLERGGYEVETMDSRQGALERMKERAFDVIMLDWKMPGGLTGEEFYGKIAAQDSELAQRVLFMSGDVVSNDFKKFLRTSGKICLSKPFDIAAFRAAVASMLKEPAGHRD